ncbi:component of SCAR regulatory complex [Cavenderia fasciculata]|uniref:Component of SCAR regulatory complex n=1 Tax=Cavenderia fasciculata TaxID=261658 RepID=F4PRC9_CACFS|nr:component of SCAR regulatory complex [Cavenderia fasciculata]EGG20481.1 component of SCAR regulatory complex [Cavenderia fasciculata]|eukprot:XP_004358331.1 component of SCAR regulatory complex [Cavenderia fasciculata]
MSEPTLDINVYTQQTIPSALAELMDNHSKMQQISAYCKQSYVPGSAEATQIYDQTQSYAKNALLNVAYHIQTIGTHLTTLTQLQLNEVDKLDLQIKYLSQRIDMIHDASGTNVFRGNDSARPYKSTLKDRKVDADSTRAPQKFVRKQVHYGISAPTTTTATLQHQQSNGSLSDSQGLPPPPPPSSTNSSNHSSQPSTPSVSSPSYTSTPPPVSAKPRPQQPPPPAAQPPSLNMPPSIPTRPPSIQQSSDFPPPPPPSFDLPPPPPSSYDFPPPPPSFNLPPPPAFDLPPPPPPM